MWGTRSRVLGTSRDLDFSHTNYAVVVGRETGLYALQGLTPRGCKSVSPYLRGCKPVSLTPSYRILSSFLQDMILSSFLQDSFILLTGSSLLLLFSFSLRYVPLR